MRRYLIILYLIFGGILLSAEAAETDSMTEKEKVKFDLLRKLSHTTPKDTARFELYLNLLRISDNTETELYYIDKMLREAQAADNKKYICQAYYSRIVLAFNMYDVESVNKWFALLEPIARKEKLYEYLFRGKRAVIDMMNVTGEYEREEKEALQMLKEAHELQNDLGMIAAYQCLSHAYRSTFREEKAAEVLEKGYEIAYRMKDKSFILEINNLLIGIYQALNDGPNILKCVKRLDAYLQECIKQDATAKEDLRGWFLITYLAYLSYYADEDDLSKANTYLKLAEEYNMDGYSVYDNYYHTARYKYFRKAKMYEEALVEVNVLIKLYKELSPVALGEANYRKAYILEALGQMDAALALYERSFSVMDSMQVVTLNTQTEQLKKDYDADQLLLKKEKIRSDIQLLFLILVIIIIVILICFVWHAYHVRVGLRKSEEEMRRMAAEMEQANIAKEHFLSTISNSISIPLNSVVDGSLKMASDEVQDVEERKSISFELNKTSAKLLELINNILDLSRLEAGMMKFKLEEVELTPFVQGIVSLMASKGRAIETYYPTTTERDLKVNVDIARLQEIFNNILLSDNERTLCLKMEVTEDNLFVRISISGSILSAYQDPPQEVAIANEVNRLLVEYFQGQYSVNHSDSSVCFALPLT